MTIPRMKIKAPVPFPATVAGTGGIKVSKSSGVWMIEPDFSQLASVLASAIGDPTSKEIWLWDPVTDDYNVLTLAGLGDTLFKLTSTTSLAVTTGPRTFVTQSGKDIVVGSWVLATDDANPTVNWMLGQVTGYTGTSLTINVTTFGGTGTYADWTIRFSGPPGSARSAGLSYQWSTDTAASDPTAGFLKANHATFGSITALYMSETDADGNAMAAELATWDDSTSTIKGRLKIYDPVTPTNFKTFDVTALADSGAYDTLTVTPIASGGAFTASLLLRADFIPKGDLGNTGAQGVNAGVNVNFDSSTTMVDPGTGEIRLNGNSAAPAAVTAIAISASSADAGNPSISAIVNAWDNSTTSAHRGTLTLRKASDTSKWVQFDITGSTTDNTSWLQLAVTHLGGPGTFSAADALVASFERTGDAGAGTGDVVGPASSTSGNLPSFNGTSGKLLQDSGIPAANVYRSGGTDVALADGGTGASLVDPNADRILFWDDSAGAMTWLVPNGNFVIIGTDMKAEEVHGIALSDETTAITTGANKATMSLPYAFTVTSIYATLNTASSSGLPTVDINEAGTTILSTKLTIDANEKTSATAATAAVISDSTIAANAEIGFDIDVAGTGAKGLKVFIRGYRT